MEESEKKYWFVFLDALVFVGDLRWTRPMDLQVKVVPQSKVAHQMRSRYEAALLGVVMTVFVVFVVVMVIWRS